MNNLLQSIREEISAAVNTAINKSGYTLERINLETPREVKFGDFSTNAAMMLAKQAKKPPREVAQQIIDNLDSTGSLIERAEIAGAGFINFHLSKGWQTSVLSIIEEMGIDYGRTDYGKGQKVMVEYVSANPTGPMHMGNARGGALGDSLAGILDMAGFDVAREFYLNDSGNQIEKFGHSLEARYMQQFGEFEFPEDGYKGSDITVRAKEFIAIHSDKYVNADPQARREALVAFSLNKNVDDIKETLGRYRIEYDSWFKESELYQNGDVAKTIELLKKTDRVYEKDGAIWLKGADKDDVLVRANGVATYFAADIAYHYNKFVTRGFDRVIDVWGADHHGHIARMKDAMRILGVDSDRLEVVTIQLVRLMKGGEVARMSKRTGEAITLSDLLDEIGVDAARFFFNMRLSNSHFDFDLDLAVEQSNENPVFYVQYAHARICSIIRQLDESGIKVSACKDTNLSLLSTQEENDILMKLAALPDEIRLSAETMEPSKLTRYAMDLAGLFHSFYNAHRVKSDDIERMKARLKLIDGVRVSIANVLKILAVDAPEKM